MARDKWSSWRTKMNRAKKLGPQTVIDLYKQFELFCEKEGWPDWWHDMQRAESDARFELSRQR